METEIKYIDSKSDGKSLQYIVPQSCLEHQVPAYAHAIIEVGLIVTALPEPSMVSYLAYEYLVICNCSPSFESYL